MNLTQLSSGASKSIMIIGNASGYWCMPTAVGVVGHTWRREAPWRQSADQYCAMALIATAVPHTAMTSSNF